MLGAFRRAARKAAFEAPVTFDPEPALDSSPAELTAPEGRTG